MSAVRIPLLAVDGGGTKCLAVLQDASRREVGIGRAGSCNYQGIGVEAASRELTLAIQQALSQVSTAASPDRTATAAAIQPSAWDIDCAVMGIAGLDTEYDRHVISSLVHEVLAKLSIQVRHLIVENDGFAALLGATGGKPGVLVIAGTGSIAYGVNEAQESVRAGGWGHRVGDEGSGYWIGKQAITAVLKAADGRGEPTVLKDMLLPFVGLQQVDELFNWTYGPQYSVEKVGELSPLVSQAAEAGDAVASAILQCAGEELYLAAKAVIEQLGMRDKSFQMILQGGVLQNDERVRRRVMEQVNGYAPGVVYESAQNDPIYGMIAKGWAYLDRRS